MTNPRIRMLLVDDHPVVRGGLRFFLAGADNIEVVGEGAGGAEALDLVARLAPDLVLIDVMMPVMDGIAATRELRRRFPEVRVLALTCFGEDELVRRALQAGAIGYLLTDTPGSELIRALRTASRARPCSTPTPPERW